jgi:hypothetical protein
MAFAISTTIVLTPMLAIMTIARMDRVCRLMLVVFAGATTRRVRIALVFPTGHRHWMHAACATVRARFTFAVAAVFLWAIAIATVTSRTRWAFAGVRARPIQIRMDSAIAMNSRLTAFTATIARAA